MHITGVKPVTIYFNLQLDKTEWNQSNHQSRITQSHLLAALLKPARRNAMVETRLTGEKPKAETLRFPLYKEETEPAKEETV